MMIFMQKYKYFKMLSNNYLTKIKIKYFKYNIFFKDI